MGILFFIIIKNKDFLSTVQRVIDKKIVSHLTSSKLNKNNGILLSFSQLITLFLYLHC